MKYGMCINLVGEYRSGKLSEKLGILKKAGFDYIEIIVNAFEGISEEEYQAIKAETLSFGIPVIRANSLIPGHVKLLGPDFCEKKLDAYMHDTFPRMKDLGVDTMVLGSGGARMIPEGFCREEARKQLTKSAQIISDYAATLGLKIALEHLNPGETNTMNSVEETVSYMKDIDRANCGLLFDYYHVDLKTNDLDYVVTPEEKLFHVHYALHDRRYFPTPANCEEEADFFKILKKVGYTDTVSLEPKPNYLKTYEEEVTEGLKFLKIGLD